MGSQAGQGHRADPISHSFFLGFGSTPGPQASAPALPWGPTPLTFPAGGRGLSQGLPQHPGGPSRTVQRGGETGREDQQFPGTVPSETSQPRVLRSPAQGTAALASSP